MGALSNAANELRKTTACAYVSVCDIESSTGYIGFDDSNPCTNITNRVTNTNSDTPPPQDLFSVNLTDGQNVVFNNPNGFSSYTSIFKIPDINLFFVVFTGFLISMAIALTLILLAISISFALKK